MNILSARLKIAPGPPGACPGFSSALEIERRPRGASQASLVPHLFRASYAWHITWSALFAHCGSAVVRQLFRDSVKNLFPRLG
ncbi:hypothetical protein [Pseudomonas eucalypticola]|uniref:Uncharacterized protein n=1 Tax=Pseudomonas eucalypticola TaxID=2599595 RepID=A0A7D5D882_9PSED|nr:hypothetical protein [Pseudomonas eucalypticola]QKZ05273.1 hypothetical protein HWQ56_16340 [Pseudomonas eucalypticola]